MVSSNKWQDGVVVEPTEKNRKNVNGASTMETLVSFGIEELERNGSIGWCSDVLYCEVVGQGLQSGEEASTGNCNRNLPRVGDHQNNLKEKCDEVDGFQGVWLRHN